MIIGGNKRAVVANIQQAIQQHQFNSKVEVGDPVFSRQKRAQVLQQYLKKYQSPSYRVNNLIARLVANTATKLFNQQTQIEGLENLQGIDGGAIITSNHFNPLENTVIRTMVHRQHKRKRLYIVCEDTNLAMTGPIGYLMRNYDTIPVSSEINYMNHQFPAMLAQALNDQQYVLIYPEQEMWFNYRKPRPLKRGAYYYAARFKVPIVACFVEIIDLPKIDNQEFQKVRYVLHVLKPIYPRAELSIRDNSIAMMHQDYAQKRAAYEQAYHQKLDYQFQPIDVAGWRDR